MNYRMYSNWQLLCYNARTLLQLTYAGVDNSDHWCKLIKKRDGWKNFLKFLTFVHKKKIIEKKGEKLYIVGDRKGAWVKGLSEVFNICKFIFF